MKKSLLLILTIVFAMCLTFTGCGGDFSMETTEDGSSLTVNTEKATDDMFAMSGTVAVAEGQKMHVEYAFTEGELEFKLIRQADEQSIEMSDEEIQDMANADNADLVEVISGEGTSDYEVEPGDYMVYASVSKGKLSGTATFSAK